MTYLVPSVIFCEMKRQDIIKIYSRYADFYDVIFSPFFLSRLSFGIERLKISKGQRILEIGTGTGLSLPFYPSHCNVVAIDITRKMLEKARKRVLKNNLFHVKLLEMDAENLSFEDDTFDHTVMPFVVNVLPDPRNVLKEVKRVTKRNGKILILNHFSSEKGLMPRVERILSPFFLKLGWKLYFPLGELSNHCSLVIEEIVKKKKYDPWLIITAVNIK